MTPEKAVAAAAQGAPAPIAAGTPAAPTSPATGPGTQPSTAPAHGGAPAARIELPDASAAYLANPAPPYPATSRRLGEQGQVLLRIWIEADGRPGQIELKRGSGYERLDRAALQAVQRWRFVPGKRAGVPEAMWVEVPLQFKLD